MTLDFCDKNRGMPFVSDRPRLLKKRQEEEEEGGGGYMYSLQSCCCCAHKTRMLHHHLGSGRRGRSSSFSSLPSSPSPSRTSSLIPLPLSILLFFLLAQMLLQQLSSSPSPSVSFLSSFANAAPTLVTEDQTNDIYPTPDVEVDNILFYNRNHERPMQQMVWTATLNRFELDGNNYRRAAYDINIPSHFTFKNSVFGDPDLSFTAGYATGIVIEGAAPVVGDVNECGPLFLTIANNIFHRSSVTLHSYLPHGSVVLIQNNTFNEFPFMTRSVNQMLITSIFLRVYPTSVAEKQSVIDAGGAGFDRIVIENNHFTSTLSHGPLSLDSNPISKSFVHMAFAGSLGGFSDKFKCLVLVRRNTMIRTFAEDGDAAIIYRPTSTYLSQACTENLFTPKIEKDGMIAIEYNTIIFSRPATPTPFPFRYLHGVFVDATGAEEPIHIADSASLVIRRNAIAFSGGSAMVGIDGGPYVRALDLENPVGCVSIGKFGSFVLQNGGKFLIDENLCDLSDSRDTHGVSVEQSLFTLSGPEAALIVRRNVIVPPKLGSLQTLSPSPLGAGARNQLPFLIIIANLFGKVDGLRAGFIVSENIFTLNDLVNYGGVYIAFVPGDDEETAGKDMVFNGGSMVEVSNNHVHGSVEVSEGFLARHKAATRSGGGSQQGQFNSANAMQQGLLSPNVPAVRNPAFGAPALQLQDLALFASFPSPPISVDLASPFVVPVGTPSSSTSSIAPLVRPIVMLLSTTFLKDFMFISSMIGISVGYGTKIFVDGNTATMAISESLEKTATSPASQLTAIVGIVYSGFRMNLRSDPAADYSNINAAPYPSPPSSASATTTARRMPNSFYTPYSSSSVDDDGLISGEARGDNADNFLHMLRPWNSVASPSSDVSTTIGGAVNPTGPHAANTPFTYTRVQSQLSTAPFPDPLSVLTIRENRVTILNGTARFGILIDSDEITLQGPYCTFDVSFNRLLLLATLALYDPRLPASGGLNLAPLMVRPRLLEFVDYDSSNVSLSPSLVSKFGGTVRNMRAAMSFSNNVIIHNTLFVKFFLKDNSYIHDPILMGMCISARPVVQSQTAGGGGTFSMSNNLLLVNSSKSANGISLYVPTSNNLGGALIFATNSKMQINNNTAIVECCRGEGLCGVVGGNLATLPRVSAFHFSFDYVGFSDASVLTICANTFYVISTGYPNFPIINAMRIVAMLNSLPTEPVAVKRRMAIMESSGSSGDLQFQSSGGRSGSRKYSNGNNGADKTRKTFGAQTLSDGRTGFNFSTSSFFFLRDNHVTARGPFFYKQLIAASLHYGMLFLQQNSHHFIIKNTLIARVTESEGMPNYHTDLLGIGLHFPRTSFIFGPQKYRMPTPMSGASTMPTDVTNLGAMFVINNYISVDSQGDYTHGIVFGNPSTTVSTTGSFVAVGCSSDVDRVARFEAPAFQFLSRSDSSSTHGLGGSAWVRAETLALTMKGADLCSGLYAYENNVEVRGTPEDADKGGTVFSMYLGVNLVQGGQLQLVRNDFTYEDIHATPSTAPPIAISISPGAASLCIFRGIGSVAAFANNTITLTSSNAPTYINFCRGNPPFSALQAGTENYLGANITFEFNTFFQSEEANAVNSPPVPLTVLMRNLQSLPRGWLSVQCNVWKGAVITDYSDTAVVTQPTAVSEVRGCTLIITTTMRPTTTPEPTTTAPTTTPAPTTSTIVTTTTPQPTTLPVTTTTPTTTPTTTTPIPTTTVPPTTTEDPWGGNAPPACMDSKWRDEIFLSAFPIIENSLSPLIRGDSDVTVTCEDVQKGLDFTFDVDSFGVYLEPIGGSGGGGTPPTTTQQARQVFKKKRITDLFSSQTFSTVRINRGSAKPASVVPNIDGLSGERDLGGGGGLISPSSSSLPRVQLDVVQKDRLVPPNRLFLGFYDPSTNRLVASPSSSSNGGSGTGSGASSSTELLSMYVEVSARTTFRVRTEPSPNYFIFTDEQFDLEAELLSAIMSVSGKAVLNAENPSYYTNGTEKFPPLTPSWVAAGSGSGSGGSGPTATPLPTTDPNNKTNDDTSSLPIPGDCPSLKGKFFPILGLRILRTASDPLQTDRLASTAVTIITAVSGMLLGFGGSSADLQTVALLGYMQCADPKTHEQFSNYRILSPFALDNSYLGVLVGNLVGAVIVLAVQLVALFATKLNNKTRRWVELQAKVFFPSVTLAAVFSFFVGTMWSLSQLIISYPTYYRYHIIPGDELVESTDSDLFGQTSWNREKYVPGGGVIAVFVLLMISSMGVAVALFVFAWRRLERAYQSYVLDDWLLRPTIQGSFLSSGFASLFLMPEGAVYSEETRKAYGSYVAPYIVVDHYWTTYPMWSGFIIFFFGLWVPSSVTECQIYFCLLAAFFIVFAVLILVFRPFRSWGDCLMTIVSKCLVSAVFFTAAASATGTNETAPTVIVIGFGVLAFVTIFRIIMHTFMLYYDDKFLKESVGVFEEWSHRPLEDRRRMKQFGITAKDEELIEAAGKRVVNDGEEGIPKVRKQHYDGDGLDTELVALGGDGGVSAIYLGGEDDDDDNSDDNLLQTPTLPSPPPPANRDYTVKSNNLINNSSLYGPQRSDKGSNIFAKEEEEEQKKNKNNNNNTKKADDGPIIHQLKPLAKKKSLGPNNGGGGAPTRAILLDSSDDDILPTASSGKDNKSLASASASSPPSNNKAGGNTASSSSPTAAAAAKPSSPSNAPPPPPKRRQPMAATKIIPAAAASSPSGAAASGGSGARPRSMTALLADDDEL